MQSPYDSYLESMQQNMSSGFAGGDLQFSPGKVAAGITLGAGLAGMTIAGGVLSTKAHLNAMAQRPGYAKMMNKVTNSEFYKSMRNPLSSMTMYMPGYREASKFDQFIKGKTANWRWNTNDKGGGYGAMMNKLFVKDIKPEYGMKLTAGAGMTGPSSAFKMGPRRVLTLPMVGIGIAAMGISNEFSSNSHASSLYKGIAKEGSAAVGMMAGQAAGFLVGSAFTPIGGVIGGLVGGAIGGMAGYGIIDTLQWMSKKGRQWTLPELGGSFRDSFMSQTMRQRSLNAIRTSQFNVRSNLGREASYLKFGY